MDKWININDELPSKNMEVIVYTANHTDSSFTVGTDYYINGEFEYYSNLVTHWQPLPDPPQ